MKGHPYGATTAGLADHGMVSSNERWVAPQSDRRSRQSGWPYDFSPNLPRPVGAWRHSPIRRVRRGHRCDGLAGAVEHCACPPRHRARAERPTHQRTIPHHRRWLPARRLCPGRNRRLSSRSVRWWQTVIDSSLCQPGRRNDPRGRRMTGARGNGMRCLRRPRAECDPAEPICLPFVRSAHLGRDGPTPRHPVLARCHGVL